MRTRSKMRATLLAVGTAVMAIAGCSSSHDMQPHLLNDDSANDIEQARLRQLQTLKMVEINDSSEEQTEYEVPMTDFGDVELSPLNNIVRIKCHDIIFLKTTDTCTKTARAAAADLCAADIYLEFASLRAEPITADTGTYTYKVGTQATAVNAALARHAAAKAREAFTQFLDALRDATGPDQTELCPDLTFEMTAGLTAAQAIGGGFVDAYTTYREAVDTFVKNTVASSDAQLSTTTSLKQGTSYAVTASALSRAAAAHALVGGDPGLFGSTWAGTGGGTDWCTVPEPTPTVRAAIEVFREAGTDPADILKSESELPLTILLENTSDCSTTCPSVQLDSAAPNFSVRERLADRWGQENALLLTTTPNLFDFFNLTQADFLAARAYLASEIKAFSRSLTATLPPPPKAGGVPTNVPLFAAVATPPPVRPPQYFAALAKPSANLREAQPTGWVADPYDLDLSVFTDWALSSASSKLEHSLDVADPTSRSQLLDPIAALVTESGHDRVGRLAIEPRAGAFDFYGLGFRALDELRIVLGEDGLACATTGSIEGAVCDVDSPDITVAELDDEWSFVWGGFSNLVYGVWETNDPPPYETRYYLVRRKSSSTGIKTFEPLIGFNLSDQANESYPIVLDAERRAGELLAPDRKWCSRTRVSCAGVDMDARIPLEDELSDDSNGVENSWRHYVDVAHRAAEDADALGEAVLDSGSGVESAELAVAGRREAAMEEVQQICGSDLDIAQLQKMVGADLEKLRTESSCVTDAECEPPAELPPGADPEMKYHCSGGFCVGDLLQTITDAAEKYPELQRIAECVVAGAVQDFVTPGSRDLCVWQKDNQINQLCADQTQQYPCPVVASDEPDLAGCAHLDTPASAAHTYDLVRISTKLGYFDYANEGAGVPRANVCESIRAMRRHKPDSAALAELISSQYFHPATFGPLVMRIAYEPRFQSHSAILLDGTPVFQTGDNWGGTSSTWPCGPRAGVTCTGSGDPTLMCSAGAPSLCAMPQVRAPINRRLLNAVVALRSMVTPDDLDAYPGTMFPGFGTYDELKAKSVNKFVRSRPGMAPVEVHEVAFKDDPRKFTFYYVNGSPQDRVAWKDVVCDTPSNCYFGDYSVDTDSAFAVIEDRPHQCVKGDSVFFDCSGLWLDGLSSSSGLGYFRDYFLNSFDPKPSSSAYTSWYPSSLPAGVQFSPIVNGAPTGVTWDSKLDALELACEVGRASETATCDLAHAPNIAVEGWPAAKRYLDCAATEIQRRGALTVYADFPNKAIDALRKQSKIGAFPALGGAYGTAVSRLRAGLVDVSDVTGLVASELRSLGTDFEQVETSVALTEVYKEKSAVQFEATVANQIASCLASSAQSIGPGPENGPAVIFNPGQAVAAAATCANSYAQVKFAGKLKALVGQEASLQAEQARLEFRQRFETHATNLQTYSSRLAKASEEIDASLSEIQSLRSQARKALHKALIDNSTVGKNQAALLSVAKARFGTAQRRYEAARHNAVLAAFIAKRAVETRFGVRMSSLKEDLPLVAAPASWEGKVCSSSGVSFDDIVREGGAKDYADAYIGDYVDKLENVVESYRLVNNFHEGTDTAVVSLKDDFNRVKKLCPTPVRNQLFHSGDFSKAGVYPVGSTVAEFPSLPAQQWALAGCVPGLPDCVGISALGEDDAPFAPAVKKLSAARGYRVVFGSDTGSCDPASCGYQAGAYVAQRVELSAGRYRLSWHARQPSALEPGVVALSGTGLAILSGPSITPLGSEGSLDVDPTGQGLWHRYWQLFEVSEAGTYAVLIGPPGSTGGAVDLAAVMLEDAPGADDNDPASTFANTGDTLTSSLPTCADTDGAMFRATKWRRGCVQLCSDGFNASCDGAAAQTYCYRETLISFSQADIDTGSVFGPSGIAKGNFNYRIERIGVNFTGTGLRNCEDSSSPLSCYGSGYWTYSLQHGGPYHVRNFTGQDVEVQLFTGNIEHARGLAAERYLTNPISGADKELMETYMRREFQGRPLDGTFVLRVWEEPGINFDALEDVQLALEYRYWTRFN